MNLKERIVSKITERISVFDEDGIYALSLLVEESGYDEEKIPLISLGYNTEKFCGKADELSEDRWNYAMWIQNNEPLLDTKDETELKKWFCEQGISDVGETENEDEMYNENFEYIGKGPKGYFEFINFVAATVCEMKNRGMFGKYNSLPVIIHDYEYSWYTLEATEKANPDGEANAFLQYIDATANIEFDE